MDKDLIRGVILVFLTCVTFASLVSSKENKNTGTRCSDGLGLNYTLPMFIECKKKLHPNGSMVQTFPKLIPYSSVETACPRRKSKLGIPPGHRVCRFPDCGENPCQHGWCEETMQNFKCHCSAGYRGKLCDKQSTATQGTDTMSTTGSTTSRTTTATPSTTSREATTNSLLDSTTPDPTTTTTSATSREATTNSLLNSTTPDPTTTTESSTTQDTETMFTTGSTTSRTTTATPSTTSREATTNSILDSTTPDPTTTTKSTTTQHTTTMSTAFSTTSRTTIATQSTAKIFVTGENGIFVADLRDDLDFTNYITAENPRYITYDSVEKKVYWTDKDTQKVYRADADDGNSGVVAFESNDDLRGIAIAEKSHTLYIANKSRKKITSVSIIAQGSSDETDFTSELSKEPYSLEVDEEKGFLYWSMKDEILRKPLNGSGSMVTIYCNKDLSKITGLSIDLSRDPRRVFFFDSGNKRRFSINDVNQPLTVADEHINNNGNGDKLRDIRYFNGALYRLKEDSPSDTRVVVTSGHDIIKQTSVIQKPFQLLIINVNP